LKLKGKDTRYKLGSSEWDAKCQSPMTYYLTPVRMAINKKIITSIGMDVEKKEPLCTVGENVYWCIH